MEIPGTASLKEARLRITTEAGAHVFLLEEPGAGRLFRMNRPLAAMFLRARGVLSGANGATAEAKAEIAALSTHLGGLRSGAVGAGRKFNPLFAMIPLFDARPLQPPLAGLARILFSRLGVALFIALMLLALWVGAASGFVFVDHIGDIFSLSALATFALIAPFLKIAHEGGHLLAATRFGVPVRNAGIMLIALFPMPFVDCTEAEFRATRLGRIVISLAGLLADLSIGFAAFILWHFVSGDFAKQLLSNIVVLNTATTLLFNLNPLMRLDGYFALSDALHRRNLHMESALTLASARRALAAFDFPRFGRAVAAAPGRIAFALMSFGYKIYILLFIAWTIAPKYLGVGLIIVVWGAAAMFLTPLLRAPAPSEARPRGARRIVWWGGVAAALAAAAFIPVRYQTVVPVALDINGAYTIRAASDGALISVRAPGPVQIGVELARAENIETAVEIALNDADRDMLAYLADSVRAENPLAAQNAEERISAAEALGADLRAEQAALTLVAKADGWFRPDETARQGARLAVGRTVGVLLPNSESAELTGALPELYARKFREALEKLELRDRSGEMIESSDLAARMGQSVVSKDGTGAFRLAVTARGSPRAFAAGDFHLKLTFSAEPLWRHGLFLVQRLRIAFLRARAEEAR